jgi:Bacterial Ig domain
VLALAAVLLAPAAIDADCNTAPTAVDDTTRAYDQSIVIDVLANDLDAGGQALTVAVTSETCPGPVSVDFGLVSYTPSTPLGQNCLIHYTVTDDEGLSATAKVTVSMITEIFSDGFETGDAAAWSACDPSCP